MEEKLMETGPATEQLIVVKQLPVIEERLREKAEEIQERTRYACSLVCTQDTLVAVKKIRADLNKEFSQYEEARKNVKRQVMAPYDSFEATYKECITGPYAEADKKLKAMVESVEYHLRDKKEKELRRYYREHLEAAGLDPSEWPFERTGISIILSRSEKSYRSEIKKWVEGRAEDIASIRTMPDADEIMVEYKRCLNLSQAVVAVSNRRAAKEAERAAREQAEAAFEARMVQTQGASEEHAEAAPVPSAEPIPATVEGEEVLRLTFSVYGTRNKLRELKRFLDEGGYIYE